MNKQFKIAVALTVFFFAFSAASAQKIAVLEVMQKKDNQSLDMPLSIQLDKITYLPDSVISLVEVKNGRRVPVACQIENKGQRILYWMLKQEQGATAKRIFELEKGIPLKIADHIKTVTENGALIVSANNKNLLQYNFKTMYPPKGVDTAFKRSGFIHPLWTPHGQLLTRINAPDHYHHYGLWNPWTHVMFEGEMIDFWNLKDKKGTVKFANFVSVNEGAVYADYQTLHEHVAFKKNGEKKVALNELQSVRIYQPQSGQDYYIADITIQLNCASDSPVTLKEYRYGGLGWRATEKWNDNNSETLTSEGKTRKDADGSKARWVIVQGSLDSDYGGAVMMSYPSNYNYPEPLRIWPEKMNGRGDVYANFSPTKDKDWPLVKGRDYILKYRFMVFNGKFNKEKAEAAWQSFANSPSVTVKLVNK
ncbi:PmoA family protein [Pedobacter ginsengisoli]|uniref:DUF6807 domain-containing protein n=1 Tax=Pedobacter ginsengisoli TaxID=363852 RepID=UPI00254AEB84|nr:PmoA family protein [Pedobacter ginsengisoli]